MKSALANEGGLLKKILALALVASLYMLFVLPTAGAASPFQASGQLVSTGNVVINSAEVSKRRYSVTRQPNYGEGTCSGDHQSGTPGQG